MTTTPDTASKLRSVTTAPDPQHRSAPMRRLVKAELFKLRTTNLWWIFALASVASTVVVLIVNLVNARAFLRPFDAYVALHDHGHVPDGGRLAELRSEWLLGHSTTTQAAAIATSGQLIGLLLVCLLGIVLVTSEYFHLTATSTFLTTPSRLDVIKAKLVATVTVAALAWLVSTVISVVAGAVVLHGYGIAAAMGQGAVLRAMGLNLVAYVLWALVGVGFGTLVRNQLGATISATIFYLVGATAAGSVFDLLNTYVIKHDWVLTAQVVVPAVASTVMISPTKTFDQSPAQWVGAVVLVAWAVLFGAVGARYLRRRDVA